ncbi:MAG: hypothetical protein KDB03_09970 [Planctomycetales bacterium]|nr:hypothetical protein [Planctomycetales bacterium]
MQTIVKYISFYLALLVGLYAKAGEPIHRYTAEFPIVSMERLSSAERDVVKVTATQWLVAGGHGVAQWSQGVPGTINKFELPDIRASFAIPRTNGQWIIGGNYNDELGYLAIHQPGDPRPLWQCNEVDHPITALAVHGDFCLIGDIQGQLTCIDLSTHQKLWTSAAHNKMLTSICVLPLNGQVASGDWLGKIILSELLSGEQVTSFSQHRGPIAGLSSIETNTATGSQLVSCSYDGTVRLWYPRQNRLVRFIQLESRIVCHETESLEAVWIGLADGRVCKGDLLHAKLRWECPSELNYVQAIRKSEETLYLSDGMRNLIGLSLSPNCE